MTEPTKDAWLEGVVQRNDRDLKRYLSQRVGNQAEVEDLAQEIYLRLLRIERKDLIRSPEALLFRVASNAVYEWRLLARNRLPHSDSELEALESIDAEPSADIWRAELAHALTAALERLTPKCRAAGAPRKSSIVRCIRYGGRRMNRLAVLATMGFLPALALGQGCGLPNSKPEAVGFSAERLQRLERHVQSIIDEKALAGAVTALARHGKVIECKSYGDQDLASAKPMALNTIFRIYSMSKPVTGVAMMLLFEEGKWKPGDPIERYIPELAHLKVYAGIDSSGNMLLEDAKHPPTIGELLTHTAGFTYGFFGETPVDKAYRADNPLASGSLTEFAQKLAKLPLLYQPGERWVYSVSVDVQGLLVERLSGQSLADFMRQRIFEPLGMKDTGFYVPAEKLARLTTRYMGDANGKLVVAPPSNSGLREDPTKPPGMASGGGGLYSTAADYVRFAQMLANGGELNGVRILAPSSVLLLRSNHVPEKLSTGAFGIGYYYMQPGLGYGYDVAVFEDPPRIGSPAGKGTFLWDGAAGTWFWVDPTNDIVFVGMIQRMLTTPNPPDMENTSRALVYQALVRP